MRCFSDVSDMDLGVRTTIAAAGGIPGNSLVEDPLHRLHLNRSIGRDSALGSTVRLNTGNWELATGDWRLLPEPSLQFLELGAAGAEILVRELRQRRRRRYCSARAGRSNPVRCRAAR